MAGVGGGCLSLGNFMIYFGEEGQGYRGQSDLPASPILNKLLQLKTFNTPGYRILGWHVLNPIKSKK